MMSFTCTLWNEHDETGTSSGVETIIGHWEDEKNQVLLVFVRVE